MEESNYIKHAKREFELLKWTRGKDEMQDMIMDNILDLLNTFSKQNHSGTTALYVLGCFEKLSRFQPLAPLTGEDNEWMEVIEGVYQNIRQSTVFKDSEWSYDIEGYIFIEKNNDTFTNGNSQRGVKFPVNEPLTPIYVYLGKDKQTIIKTEPTISVAERTGLQLKLKG